MDKYPSCATTLDYWDCNCETDYIRPATQKVCFKCGVAAGEQPDARINEVEEMLAKQRGKKVVHKNCGGTIIMQIQTSTDYEVILTAGGMRTDYGDVVIGGSVMETKELSTDEIGSGLICTKCGAVVTQEDVEEK